MKFRLNGKQVYRSTGTMDALAAAQEELRVRKELIFGAEKEEKRCLTLSEAIARADRERYQFNRDGVQTVTMLERIQQICGDVLLNAIDSNTITKLKSKLLETGVTHATVNRYLSHLRTILNLAYKEWGAIKKVPPFKLSKETKGRTRVLTVTEEQALINFFQAGGKRDADWSIIADLVIVLVETGMRLSEALGLTPASIDTTNRYIHLLPTDTKSGKARTLPMSDRCWAVVEPRLSMDKLFDISKYHVCQTFAKARQTLNLEGVSAHVCRHTFASRMLAEGQSIAVVQQWLGHASIQMTVDRYGHLDVTSLKNSLNGR